MTGLKKLGLEKIPSKLFENPFKPRSKSPQPEKGVQLASLTSDSSMPSSSAASAPVIDDSGSPSQRMFLSAEGSAQTPMVVPKWVDVGDFGSGWTPAASKNSLLRPAGFCVNDQSGVVMLRGCVFGARQDTKEKEKAGTPKVEEQENLMFHLPEQARPKMIEKFVSALVGKHVKPVIVTVQPDGFVLCSAPGGEVWLSGITFSKL